MAHDEADPIVRKGQTGRRQRGFGADVANLLALTHGVAATIGAVYVTTKSVLITTIACCGVLLLAVLLILRGP